MSQPADPTVAQLTGLVLPEIHVPSPHEAVRTALESDRNPRRLTVHTARAKGDLTLSPKARVGLSSTLKDKPSSPHKSSSTLPPQRHRDRDTPKPDPADPSTIAIDPETGLPAISLLNFDPHAPSVQLTSPRSIEACARLGIIPKDLLARPATYFEEQLYTRRQNGDALDPKYIPQLAQEKFIHCENKRQVMTVIH